MTNTTFLSSCALASLVGWIFGAVGVDPDTFLECGPRGDMLAILHESYGEELAAAGLNENLARVEVYISHETGSWTIARSQIETTCILSHGTFWQGRPFSVIRRRGG